MYMYIFIKYIYISWVFLTAFVGGGPGARTGQTPWSQRERFIALSERERVRTTPPYYANSPGKSWSECVSSKGSKRERPNYCIGENETKIEIEIKEMERNWEWVRAELLAGWRATASQLITLSPDTPMLVRHSRNIF